ncbi:MAG: FtsX-like permease family protein [Bacteroidales bacterium]|jgi:cell division transport system permease protein|nr:FtsX-like permease family protein [Bacteroidales bacterium]
MPKQSFKPKKKKLFGARFTSTLSVALVLFVLGVGALGGLAVAGLADVMREQFTITIVVNDAAGDKYAKQLVAKLDSAAFTSKASYISADSALQIVTRELGESPEDFLGYNPLQPSVELQLKSAYARRDSIAPIIESLRQQAGQKIDSIDYNEDLLDAVNANIHRTAIVLAILAAVLILISMTLVANTVRLALHADRFIIGTMRLVGATDWFIRRPFVVGQVWHGLLAAAVAMLAIAVLFFFGMDATGSAAQAFVQLVFNPLHVACVAVGMILAGMMIPALAAWQACNKYLHCTTDELYLM